MGFLGKAFGSAKNLVLGKKDPGVQDQFIELDESLKRVTEAGRAKQLQGLDIYGKELDVLGQRDSGAEADIEMAQKEKIFGQAGQDAVMRAKQNIAQRGLDKSAIGLRAILNTEQQGIENLANLKASAPLLKAEAAQRKYSLLNLLTGGVNQTLGATGAERGFVQGRESRGRGGGLLGLGLGTLGALGSMRSGGDPSQGFQAGAGAGRAFANL